MFWELFFLWPCICGSEYTETYINNGKFNDIFKGTAAQSFRDFVKSMGHTESTYPYHATGAVVLKFWKGPNFKSRGGGNNLPNNTLPWDKKDDRTKKDVGNNAKMLPGNLEEVGAETDMDEDKTEEVIAEVVDGNDADGDEAMELEGNEAVGVCGNKDEEEKEVNGVVDGKKNNLLEEMNSEKGEKISEEECKANHSC